jgi:hypothetical protein
MDVHPEDVRITTEVFAVSSSPLLDVLEIAPVTAMQEQHSWARIGCHDPHECAPFYVDVHWPHSVPRPQTRVTRPQYADPPVIRPGDRATLVVEDARIHIELDVVALQNGSPGQVIRLATPDHRQFYRGVVVSRFRLTGRL